MTDLVKINRGLKGIYFERSGVSQIDGSKSELSYRGYSIHDLATQATFEEVAFLPINGELLTKTELTEFNSLLKSARTLPQHIIEIIRGTKEEHPMDVLRTAVLTLATFAPDSQNVNEEAFMKNGIRLISQVPIINAAHHNIRNGQVPVFAYPNLGHASNWLWMLKGKKPSEGTARLADIDFILHAKHGSNASSFAARLTVGTEADLNGTIVAALATLAGPAHGGAAEGVIKMLYEIAKPENAAEYVKSKRKTRQPITGFVHYVYRTEDPRAQNMRNSLQQLSEEMGRPEWYEILQAVIEAMKPSARYGLNVNIDFYSGMIYQLNGIKIELYVPIFAIGRMLGWIIQCIEQLRGNILMHLLKLYNGPRLRDYIPIEKRDIS